VFLHFKEMNSVLQQTSVSLNSIFLVDEMCDVHWIVYSLGGNQLRLISFITRGSGRRLPWWRLFTG